MVRLFRKLLILGYSEIDCSRVGNQGAIILDVRSEVEYLAGHIKGSINIPADILSYHLNRLKSIDRPILICCASGKSSRLAKQMLKSSGLDNVYNGGGWKRLANRVY